MISARALHFVLKIGDRGANAFFFRNILGMKVSTVLVKKNIFFFFCLLFYFLQLK